MLFSKIRFSFQYSNISLPVCDKFNCLYSLYISALSPKFEVAKLRSLPVKIRVQSDITFIPFKSEITMLNIKQIIVINSKIGLFLKLVWPDFRYMIVEIEL